MTESRKIIELLDKLSKRAMSIALHNLDELGIDGKTTEEKTLFCFLVSLEEHKRESQSGG